jgi:DnaJ-domain-containing protein 1
MQRICLMERESRAATNLPTIEVMVSRSLESHLITIKRLCCPSSRNKIRIAWSPRKTSLPKSMKTHYETLGIPKDASAERVKASYRALVKTYHPDRLAEGTKLHAEAEKRIREINVAYAVLSKPLSRASYDAKLNNGANLEVGPEYCANCGKPTTYWHTNTKVPLCHACRGGWSGRGVSRTLAHFRAAAQGANQQSAKTCSCSGSR